MYVSKNKLRLKKKTIIKKRKNVSNRTLKKQKGGASQETKSSSKPFCVNDINNFQTSKYNRIIEQGIRGSGEDSQIFRFSVELNKDPEIQCENGMAEVIFKKHEDIIKKIFDQIYPNRKISGKIKEMKDLLDKIKETYEHIFTEQMVYDTETSKLTREKVDKMEKEINSTELKHNMDLFRTKKENLEKELKEIEDTEYTKTFEYNNNFFIVTKKDNDFSIKWDTSKVSKSPIKIENNISTYLTSFKKGKYEVYDSFSTEMDGKTIIFDFNEILIDNKIAGCFKYSNCWNYFPDNRDKVKKILKKLKLKRNNIYVLSEASKSTIEEILNLKDFFADTDIKMYNKDDDNDKSDLKKHIVNFKQKKNIKNIKNIIYVSKDNDLNEIATLLGCGVPVLGIHNEDKVGYERLQVIFGKKCDKSNLKVRKIEKTSKINLKDIVGAPKEFKGKEFGGEYNQKDTLKLTNELLKDFKSGELDKTYLISLCCYFEKIFIKNLGKEIEKLEMEKYLFYNKLIKLDRETKKFKIPTENSKKINFYFVSINNNLVLVRVKDKKLKIYDTKHKHNLTGIGNFKSIKTHLDVSSETNIEEEYSNNFNVKNDQRNILILLIYAHILADKESLLTNLLSSTNLTKNLLDFYNQEYYQAFFSAAKIKSLKGQTIDENIFSLPHQKVELIRRKIKAEHDRYLKYFDMFKYTLYNYFYNFPTVYFTGKIEIEKEDETAEFDLGFEGEEEDDEIKVKIKTILGDTVNETLPNEYSTTEKILKSGSTDLFTKYRIKTIKSKYMSSFYKLLVAHKYYIKNCEYILKSNVTIGDIKIYNAAWPPKQESKKTIKIKMKNCQNLEEILKKDNIIFLSDISSFITKLIIYLAKKDIIYDEFEPEHIVFEEGELKEKGNYKLTSINHLKLNEGNKKMNRINTISSCAECMIKIITMYAGKKDFDDELVKKYFNFWVKIKVDIEEKKDEYYEFNQLDYQNYFNLTNLLNIQIKYKDEDAKKIKTILKQKDREMKKKRERETEELKQIIDNLPEREIEFKDKDEEEEEEDEEGQGQGQGGGSSTEEEQYNHCVYNGEEMITVLENLNNIMGYNDDEKYKYDLIISHFRRINKGEEPSLEIKNTNLFKYLRLSDIDASKKIQIKKIIDEYINPKEIKDKTQQIIDDNKENIIKEIKKKLERGRQYSDDYIEKFYYNKYIENPDAENINEKFKDFETVVKNKLKEKLTKYFEEKDLDKKKLTFNYETKKIEITKITDTTPEQSILTTLFNMYKSKSIDFFYQFNLEEVIQKKKEEIETKNFLNATAEAKKRMEKRKAMGQLMGGSQTPFNDEEKEFLKILLQIMLIEEGERENIINLYSDVKPNPLVNLKNIIEVYYFYKKYKKENELFKSLFTDELNSENFEYVLYFYQNENKDQILKKGNNVDSKKEILEIIYETKHPNEAESKKKNKFISLVLNSGSTIKQAFSDIGKFITIEEDKINELLKYIDKPNKKELLKQYVEKLFSDKGEKIKKKEEEKKYFYIKKGQIVENFERAEEGEEGEEGKEKETILPEVVTDLESVLEELKDNKLNFFTAIGFEENLEGVSNKTIIIGETNVELLDELMVKTLIDRIKEICSVKGFKGGGPYLKNTLGGATVQNTPRNNIKFTEGVSPIVYLENAVEFLTKSRYKIDLLIPIRRCEQIIEDTSNIFSLEQKEVFEYLYIILNLFQEEESKDVVSKLNYLNNIIKGLKKKEEIKYDLYSELEGKDKDKKTINDIILRALIENLQINTIYVYDKIPDTEITNDLILQYADKFSNPLNYLVNFINKKKDYTFDNRDKLKDVLEKKLIEAFRKAREKDRIGTLENFRTEFESLFEGKKFEQSIKETAELELGKEKKKAELEYNKKLENTDLKDFFKNVKSFTITKIRHPERKIKKITIETYNLYESNDKKNLYSLNLINETVKTYENEQEINNTERNIKEPELKGFIAEINIKDKKDKIILTGKDNTNIKLEKKGKKIFIFFREEKGKVQWMDKYKIEKNGDMYFPHNLHKNKKKIGSDDIKFVFKDDNVQGVTLSKLPRAKQTHESSTISEPGTQIQIDLKSISYLSIELKQDTKEPDKSSTKEPDKGSTKNGFIENNEIKIYEKKNLNIITQEQYYILKNQENEQYLKFIKPEAENNPTSDNPEGETSVKKSQEEKNLDNYYILDEKFPNCTLIGNIDEKLTPKDKENVKKLLGPVTGTGAGPGTGIKETNSLYLFSKNIVGKKFSFELKNYKYDSEHNILYYKYEKGRSVDMNNVIIKGNENEKNVCFVCYRTHEDLTEETISDFITTTSEVIFKDGEDKPIRFMCENTDEDYVFHKREYLIKYKKQGTVINKHVSNIVAAAFSNNIKPLAEDTEYKEGDIVYVNKGKENIPDAEGIQKNMFDIIKEIHLVLTKTNKTNLTKLIKALIKGEEGEEKEEEKKKENIMETQDAIQALKKIVLHYNTEEDFLLGENFFEELYIQNRTLSNGSNEETIYAPSHIGDPPTTLKSFSELSPKGGYRTRRNRHSKTKKKINSPNSLKYTKKNIFSKLNKTLKKIKKKYKL